MQSSNIFDASHTTRGQHERDLHERGVDYLREGRARRIRRRAAVASRRQRREGVGSEGDHLLRARNRPHLSGPADGWPAVARGDSLAGTFIIIIIRSSFIAGRLQ